MPFANIDDNFPEHPKIDGLSDAAFRLHVSGICFASRHLTDGLIPADRVPRLVPRYRKAAANELVERGIWYWHESIKSYEIHDYLDWNRSREHITSERERVRKMRSEAGRKGAAARWGNA